MHQSVAEACEHIELANRFIGGWATFPRKDRDECASPTAPPAFHKVAWFVHGDEVVDPSTDTARAKQAKTTARIFLCPTSRLGLIVRLLSPLDVLASQAAPTTLSEWAFFLLDAKMKELGA